MLTESEKPEPEKSQYIKVWLAWLAWLAYLCLIASMGLSLYVSFKDTNKLHIPTSLDSICELYDSLLSINLIIIGSIVLFMLVRQFFPKIFNFIPMILLRFQIFLFFGVQCGISALAVEKKCAGDMRVFTIAAVVLTGVFLSLITKKLIYPACDNKCRSGRFHANVRSV